MEGGRDPQSGEFLVKFVTLETFSIIKFAMRFDIKTVPLTLVPEAKSTPRVSGPVN